MIISADSIDSESVFDSNKTDRLKNDNNRATEMKQIVDLLSILEKLIQEKNSLTVPESLILVDNYCQEFDKIFTKIDAENEFHKAEDLLCHNCRCKIHEIHYVCSHCKMIILCEACENHSEEFHDYNYIKIKKQFTIKCLPIRIVANFSKSLSSLLQDFRQELSDFYEKNHITKNMKRQSKIQKIQAGSRITKVWNVVNNGECDWDDKTVLCCVSENIRPTNNEISIPISLAVGETQKVAINYVIPSDIQKETLFFGNWEFHREGKSFGDALNFKILAIPNQDDRNSEVSSTTNLDDIPYPPCFDLNVFFPTKPHKENLFDSGKEKLSHRSKLPPRGLTKPWFENQEKDAFSTNTIIPLWRPQFKFSKQNALQELQIPSLSQISVNKIARFNENQIISEQQKNLTLPKPCLALLSQVTESLKKKKNNLV